MENIKINISDLTATHDKNTNSHKSKNQEASATKTDRTHDNSKSSVSRHKKSISRKIKKSLYITLSFILSILLTIILLLTTLQTTILNPEFIYRHMEKSDYFSAKQYEIEEAFIDIGYASGLNEKFWDNLADEDMIRDDTVTYLYNYYSGKSSVVDVTNFEMKLRNNLDEYILKNNIKNVDNAAIKYLIVITRSTYKAHLELPLFSRIAYYMVVAKKIIPIVITVLALIIALICFAFVYKKKSEGIKYICYSTSSAFLITIVIPLSILISDKVKYLNLSSQALYHFILSFANSVCYTMIIFAMLSFVFSVILFLLYLSKGKNKKREKLHN